MTRNIGIVGDGTTDRAIFQKIIQVMLGNSSTPEQLNFVELKRPNLRDFVDNYWKDANKQNQYYLPSTPAVKLQNEVTNTILGAFRDFESEIGIGELRDSDILVITTDSEKQTKAEADYFQEWAFSISKLFQGAIEKFYSQQLQIGYSCNCLPLVLSLICFPSTEILVAAAKNTEPKIYGKKPGELKQQLYGTDDLSTLSEEDLKTKALDFITPASIETIFAKVPESRIFIKTLLSHNKVDNEDNAK